MGQTKAPIKYTGLPMQIRPLDPADADAFQALRLSALCECPTAFASSYEEECEIPMSTVAERLTIRADRCVIGAFEGGELVGNVGLRREEKRKLAHKAFIWGMYVAPAFRRQGIGRQLVAQAVAQAASMPGVRQLNLGVNAANAAAIALYEALGFQPFGLERGFMLINGVLHDEILMTRSVDGVGPLPTNRPTR